MSRRSTQEKEPWKLLPGVEQAVEAEFLRPVLLGESILPFRTLQAFEGVIPVDARGIMLDAAAAARRGKTGLTGWLTAAEEVWEDNKTATVNLNGQFDYYGKLASQFPVADLRVCYAASGTLPCALVVRDPRAIIEHAVYWTKVSLLGEGNYLAAILNSETTRARVADLQARGQWGARHFDKVMFTLPIPRFNPKDPLHVDLNQAGSEAEKVAASVAIPDGVHFQTARRRVREALAEAGVARRIDDLVAMLLHVNAKPSLKRD
jgi:hypothetical protein